MPITAIVGANWGDEGKGKMTDALAASAGIVVRYQGGDNAGHTIINEHGKFVLRLLPSGVFHPHVLNVVGPGVALNMTTLLAELAGLATRNVPTPRLAISERAQVMLPYHLLLDQYEEERLGTRQFGSTRRGIAPFYADKQMKVGVQVADLYDERRLFGRIAQALETKSVLFEHLYHKPRPDAEAIVAGLLEQAEQIRPYVQETTSLLHGAWRDDTAILLEGQLGALRDPDHGIYPFSTSTSTLAGAGAVGAGLPPHAIRRVVAVMKAYSTCVGAGPFVSEIFGEQAEELRRRGGDAGEYGAATGRPRRVGWFDVPASRYGCRVQGATEIALTMLDVLGYLEEIPVCIAYEIDGVRIDDFPTPARLERAQPVVERLPGWRCELSHVRRHADLPDAAKRYVRAVEEWAETPVCWVSVGPGRDALIEL